MGTQPEARVTLRSIVIGLCIAMAMSVLACTARYLQKGSYMMVAQIPMGVLLLCLVSILGCAPCLPGGSGAPSCCRRRNGSLSSAWA